MTFVILAAAALLVAVAVRLSVPRLRRYRIEAELHGDWWTRFEREFRAYSSRPWRDARHGERRG